MAVSNSKLNDNSNASPLMSHPKFLMNPVMPVSVSKSGKEDILAGTPILSKSLLSPLDAKLNGTFCPTSLVLSSKTVCVHVPPAASQSVLFLLSLILHVPL